MSKFKNFLLEDVGLGQLGLNIEKLFQSQEFNDKIGGALTSSDVNGTEGKPSVNQHQFLSNTDVNIPSIKRSGRIIAYMPKKNPIYIRLSDGTDCYFTYDQFRKIQGKPAMGKVMHVTFQRHPNNNSELASKIDQAIVTD